MFATLIALQARQNLLLLGGVNGSYTDANGTTDPVLLLLDEDVSVVVDNGLTVTQTDTVSYLKADLPAVLRGGLFTIGSEEYSVQHEVSDDGAVATVAVR